MLVKLVGLELTAATFNAVGSLQDVNTSAVVVAIREGALALHAGRKGSARKIYLLLADFGPERSFCFSPRSEKPTHFQGRCSWPAGFAAVKSRLSSICHAAAASAEVRTVGHWLNDDSPDFHHKSDSASLHDLEAAWSAKVGNLEVVLDSGGSQSIFGGSLNTDMRSCYRFSS